MFGRSVSLALALLLAATPAFAKVQNFNTGIPFGLGFSGGFEPRPASNLVAGTVNTSSNYSRYVRFEPFLDLINVVFRPSVAYHFYPLAKGSGTDSHGAFAETSQVGAFDYGLKIQMAPWVAKNLQSRAFMAVGIWKSATRARDSRVYSATQQAYSESLHGTGNALSLGVGAETFLMQNYSLQIETGYTQRSVDSFGYFSTVDSSGAAQTNGATAHDSSGRNKALHLWGPYLELTVNLNF
jgi:hypothetical protein